MEYSPPAVSPRLCFEPGLIFAFENVVRGVCRAIRQVPGFPHGSATVDDVVHQRRASPTRDGQGAGRVSLPPPVAFRQA